MVSFDRLNVVGAGPATVAVHDEGDVLGDGAAFEGADEEFADVLECVLDGREGEEPALEGGRVEGRHVGGE